MGDRDVNARFEEHRREQRRAWLRLTHRQRLDWLEQAKRFATRALAAARERVQRASKSR
jgi:predicted GIY-YIG superfamily endonuclease